MKCEMVPGGTSVSHLIREVSVIEQPGIWKSGEAPDTYGTDKGSISVVHCDVDSSETCWCKVATKRISTHYLCHHASVYPSISLTIPESKCSSPGPAGSTLVYRLKCLALPLSCQVFVGFGQWGDKMFLDVVFTYIDGWHVSTSSWS